MHVPINVKSCNNISEWQMGLNSAFKGLTSALDGHKWPVSRPVRFTPAEKVTDINLMRDLVGPKPDLWEKNVKEYL